MRHNLSKNKILVGPARSGTTLACRLLNHNVVENIIALDEPFSREEISEAYPEDCLELVSLKFVQARKMFKENKMVPCTIGSEGLDNHYEESTGKKLRKRVVRVGTMLPQKPLDEEFEIVIKHTIPFTAIIEQLSRHYPTYGIVRNPLSILASWNTIDAAYRQGRVPPYVHKVTGDLKWWLPAVRNLFERQTVLLSWHFEKLLPLLMDNKVIRYEDIVSSAGRALSVITPKALNLTASLKSYNENLLYERPLIEELRLALHRLGGAIWEFYSRREVDGLFEYIGDVDNSSISPDKPIVRFREQRINCYGRDRN
ncbi:hypothetical protein [Iodidimonas sp. SYSU 1G8]|uniref:hypothetical protein n=1 Tax=Iodidimonas sp. SYSU 1G8 TaxID=3133967 RepID=UPI0031FE7508